MNVLITIYFVLDVIELLLENKADVNDQCFFGTSPLHKAAQYGHVECAKLLLDQVKISTTNDLRT